MKWRKLLACALAALMLIAALPCALAEEGETELAAVCVFAYENTLPVGETKPELMSECYLRAAYRVDVAASVQAMGDSKYLGAFTEAYGEFDTVYLLEYACLTGSNPIPVRIMRAVGVDAAGEIKQCPDFDAVQKETMDVNWCAGAALERVYDVTLDEACAANAE